MLKPECWSQYTTKEAVKLRLEEIPAWTGFEPMTSTISVQCSQYQLTIKPTGSLSIPFKMTVKFATKPLLLANLDLYPLVSTQALQIT